MLYGELQTISMLALDSSVKRRDQEKEKRQRNTDLVIIPKHMTSQ